MGPLFMRVLAPGEIDEETDKEAIEKFLGAVHLHGEIEDRRVAQIR